MTNWRILIWLIGMAVIIAGCQHDPLSTARIEIGQDNYALVYPSSEFGERGVEPGQIYYIPGGEWKNRTLRHSRPNSLRQATSAPVRFAHLERTSNLTASAKLTLATRPSGQT